MRMPVCVKLDFDFAFLKIHLPSALLVERFIRSVPVGCSRFSRCCHLIVDLRFHLATEVGPGHRRSHRNSALWARCSRFDESETMRLPAIASGGCCAAARKPLRSPTSDAATPPACVRSRSPLVSCHSSAALRQLQAPAPQIAVRSKRPQNVVRTLHQQRS